MNEELKKLMEKAELLALKTCIEIMNDATADNKDRVEAARIVLPYAAAMQSSFSQREDWES